ncbi:molybdopterin-dependent oxidoreductase [Alicyclobacillus sp. ALC3]|nr:molybdopterin-dependent oxidoreductase [Alicyclobacillus sp. ALC3]
MYVGDIPQINRTEWSLKIFGEVQKPVLLSWDEVRQLPKSRYTSDAHCVTTWSRLDNHWEGVSFSDLLTLVNPDPTANFVMVYGEQGYSANFPIHDLLRDGVLLAYTLDDKELATEHGFPLRLVVPHLYFWKSVKWVWGIEFLSTNKLGFWEQSGYHPHGDPWLQQRYTV